MMRSLAVHPGMVSAYQMGGAVTWRHQQTTETNKESR